MPVVADARRGSSRRTPPPWTWLGHLDQVPHQDRAGLLDRPAWERGFWPEGLEHPEPCDRGCPPRLSGPTPSERNCDGSIRRFSGLRRGCTAGAARWPRVPAGGRGLRPRAHSLEPCRRPAASRRRGAVQCRRRGAGHPRGRGPRAEGRAPEHRSQCRAARRTGGWDAPAAHDRIERGRDRPGTTPGPGHRRHHLAARGRRRVRARARRHAWQRPRHRCGRLHARWRPVLVCPQVRVGLQPRCGGRDRARRWHAAPRPRGP